MPSSFQGVSELPYICHEYGVAHAVISPGSRNAPLIIAFTSHPHINCISITDERSAAYYALGMAQQLKKPVALICTSGTAMINYSPALAEAYYMNIPLVAITADRPPEWIDQNDGQTIRQKELYSNFIKGSFQTPVETEKQEDLWFFHRMISEALNVAVAPLPGPVHINMPLREPLYEPLPEVDLNNFRIIKTTPVTPTTSSVQVEMLKSKWQNYEKRLIICGMGNHDPVLAEVLTSIVNNDQAVVIAENLSNLKVDGSIETPDSFMASLGQDDLVSFRPDLLITCGGAVLSKKLKRFLREYQPGEHWHFGPNAYLTDTFQSLNLVVDSDPAELFTSVSQEGASGSVYVVFARNKNITLMQLHRGLFDEMMFSDMVAYQLLLENIPENSSLHLANSTPVRYSQLFTTRAGIGYYSNRGTSGIDGCISTAAGAAMVSGEMHIALAGDLAFIYDSNALWNNKLPPNLRVIVIDNGGGNIFRLIDTSPVINPIREFFETPHNVDIKKLCEAYHVDYYFADNKESLVENINPFFKPNGRPAVLHIITSGEASSRTFKQYYQFISQKK